jgi:hypothetical protein
LKDDFGRGVKKHLKIKSEKTKNSLVVYSILTLISYICDCANFVISYAYFGVDGH